MVKSITKRLKCVRKTTSEGSRPLRILDYVIIDCKEVIYL